MAGGIMIPEFYDNLVTSPDSYDSKYHGVNSGMLW